MIGKSIRIRLYFCKVNGKTLYSLLTGSQEFVNRKLTSCRQALNFLPTENALLVFSNNQWLRIGLKELFCNYSCPVFYVPLLLFMSLLLCIPFCFASTLALRFPLLCIPSYLLLHNAFFTFRCFNSVCLHLWFTCFTIVGMLLHLCEALEPHTWTC